jgi:tetratricopeptide (TPR) repeat protein
MNREKVLIVTHLLLIALLSLIVYGNSLSDKFTWDDNAFIKNNQYIKSWSYIPKLFTENLGLGVGKVYIFYRPLQMLSYTMDYSSWRLDARGYHLTNIIFHILAAFSIYRLISLLFGDRGLSFLTSILFAVHPVHTGAVASIAGRADPIATALLLTSFALYIKNIRGWNIGAYVCMLLCYASALLSRENTLVLPLLLLVYHYAFKEKFDKKLFLPILGLAAFYIILRLTFFNRFLFQGFGSSTLLQRLPGFFAAIAQYVRLLLWPFGLHMIYGKGLFGWNDPGVIIGIVILLSLIFSALIKKKTDRLYFFGVSLFFITLLPQSNLYPINAYMAEHWLYIPSIGFFLIVAKGLLSLYRKKNFLIVISILTAALLAFYSFLTVRQNNYWRDPILFCERTLKYAPDSEWMYNNLGNAYYAAGRRQDAVAVYKRAIELKPDFDYAYYNLANAHSGLGRKEDAVLLFQKAIDINPNYAHAYNNLGVIYYELGRNEDAITSYRKAVDIKPDFADAHFNLGNILFYTGKVEESIESFNSAIRVDPHHIDAYHNLATLYLRTGKTGEAVSAYKKALGLNPDYPLVHKNLSIAYFREKKFDLAVEHFDRAIELGCEMDPEFTKRLDSYRGR